MWKTLCCFWRDDESTKTSKSRPSSTRLSFSSYRRASLGRLSISELATSKLLGLALTGSQEQEHDYVIRPIREEELDEALEIRMQSNYTFGKECCRTAWKITPDHFLVAAAEDRLLGIISLTEFSENLVYSGLLCVREECRGLGIAKELLLENLECVGDRNLFVRVAEHIEKLQSAMKKYPVRSNVLLMRTFPTKLDPEKLKNNCKGVEVKDYKDDMFEDVLKYDADVMRCVRRLVLKYTIEEAGALTKVAFRNGAVVGFGIIQEMRDNTASMYHLAGETRDIGKVLLKELVFNYKPAMENGIVLVTPCYPDHEHSFDKEVGMEPKNHSVCRFSKEEVPFDYSRIYSM